MGAYGSPELYPYDGKKNAYKPRKPKKPILHNIFAVIFVAAVVFYLYNYTGVVKKTVKVSNAGVTSQLTQVNVGDAISNNSVEITLVNVSFADEIVSDWSSVKQEYKVPDGNTCVRVDLNIKNNGTESIKCEKLLACQVLYDNEKYKYSGNAAIKDANTGFGNYPSAEILPLETKSVILMIPVPPEVRDSDKTLDVVFGQQNNLLNYKMR